MGWLSSAHGSRHGGQRRYDNSMVIFSSTLLLASNYSMDRGKLLQHRSCASTYALVWYVQAWCTNTRCHATKRWFTTPLSENTGVLARFLRVRVGGGEIGKWQHANLRQAAGSSKDVTTKRKPSDGNQEGSKIVGNLSAMPKACAARLPGGGITYAKMIRSISWEVVSPSSHKKQLHLPVFVWFYGCCLLSSQWFVPLLHREYFEYKVRSCVWGGGGGGSCAPSCTWCVLLSIVAKRWGILLYSMDGTIRVAEFGC